MNHYQFIFLRLYNISLGRIVVFNFFLKKIMVHCLVKRAKEKYTAASRYFDYKLLKKEDSR
jgi:hypothetical protein